MGGEDPRAAGAYAAVSVACKSLVFVSLVVAGYLLPEAAISWREGGHALRQLCVAGALDGVRAAVLVGAAAGAVATTIAVVAAHGVPRSTAVADLAVQAALASLAAAELVRAHRRHAGASLAA